MECLCDVVITDPVTIMPRPLYDGWKGREIVAHLKLSAPFTNSDILRILSFQAEIHDRVHLASQIRLPVNNRPAKVTRPIQEFVAEQVLNGMPSAKIRADVARIFQVEVSPAYMSMLRKRLVNTYPDQVAAA